MVRPLSVAIAGGSIGGLCAGAALKAIGCDVHIHERASGPLTGRGAGIVVQPQLIELLRRVGAPQLSMTSCRYRHCLLPDGGEGVCANLPLRLTSWSAIYQALRSAFPADRYHEGSAVRGFEQTPKAVQVQFTDRDDALVDLLVCADGSRSEMRNRVDPQAVPHYVGYVAWRGIVAEEDAHDQLVRFFDQSFSICEARSGGHILCYVIPGLKAASEAGRRYLNWVWYVGVSDGPTLDRLLTDKDGRRHPASVSAGMVPADEVKWLRAFADKELHPRFAELVQNTSEPFLQAIIDVDVTRMALGRVCLLGDAAFVLRPHPAVATAKAAADAMALADTIKSLEVEPALADWEQRQMAYGGMLASRSKALGARTVAHGTVSRNLGEVVERFCEVALELPID